MSRMKSLTKILSFALVVGSALAPQTSSAQPKSPNTNSIDVRCRATNGRNNSIVFTLTNQQETLTLDSADPEFMYLSISHETPDRSQVYTNARYEIILNRPSKQVARNFKRSDNEIVPGLSAQFKNLRCSPIASK